MKNKDTPDFKSIAEEREFWDSHDSTDYFEEAEIDLLITGGPKSEVMHIRIEPQVKEQIDRYARINRKDSSDLAREWIYDGIENEIEKQSGVPSSVCTDDLREIVRSEIRNVLKEMKTPTTVAQRSSGVKRRRPNTAEKTGK